ncbi:MAG: pyruvate dehydrogenase complex dihydrolipoamide acetyltransferase [Bacteroidota bacterium]
MAEVIRMPKMSDTMTEGVIVAWHKKVGDDVKSGDILAEVETDKATMELENYVKGTLLHIGIEAGQSVPVDAVIAIVGAKGEDVSALLNAAPTAAAPAPSAPAAETPVAETPAPQSQIPNPKSEIVSGDSRLKASPLAKKIAEEKGVDISKVSGSGDNGRIIKKDVESYSPAAAASANKPSITLPSVVGTESFDEVSVSQMRKAIARRLSESKNGAPHFYLTMAINMDKVIEARKAMNDISPVKISVNDIIIKAVAASLRANPKANSSWLGDKIRMNHHIHIGVAVAIEDGLIVPVVKFADNKTISHISAEVKELAARAKSKKLQPNEFEGSTFSISNLGMFGIEQFTAIINPPESCILAVGAASETVIVENGQMKVANIMKVTLSCDHRSVDGAVGSAFLQTLKDMLENPVRLLV